MYYPLVQQADYQQKESMSFIQRVLSGRITPLVAGFAKQQKLDAAGIWDDPIVTEITPFTNFYKAEDYHQNYYNLNGNQPYCRAVIVPKLEKFREVFKDKLK